MSAPGSSCLGPVGAALVAALVVLLCALIAMLALDGTLRARLAARGWLMYTLPGCAACTQQLRILGPSLTYSPTRVCLAGTPDCPDAFPTWRNVRTGEVRVGVQGAAALRAMAA